MGNFGESPVHQILDECEKEELIFLMALKLPIFLTIFFKLLGKARYVGDFIRKIPVAL